MLTNQYGEKLSKTLKQSFFKVQMTLINNSVQIPFLVYFLISIITFIINISIFFESNPLQPQIFNESFSFVLIYKISQKIGISLNVIKIILSLESFILIGVYIVHLKSNFYNGFFTKLLYFLIMHHAIFAVPRVHLMLTGIKNLDNVDSSVEIIINVMNCICTCFNSIVVAAYTLFRIRQFRKKSIYWSIDNNFQFYSYVLNLARVTIIVVDGYSIALLMVSLALQLLVRATIGGHLTKFPRKMQTLVSNLNISVHIALIAGGFTQNGLLASQILGFLITISLINSILSSYSILNQQKYFPLCNSEINEYYDFYFNFIEQKIKGNNKAKLSIKKDSQSDKILSIHTLNCQQKNCKVKKVKLSEQTYCQDLQNLCNDMMVQQNLKSQRNQLIYELWKYQTGNKYKFRMQSKKISIINQYIVYSSLNYSRLNQNSDSINVENIKSLKNIFYDKLQACLFSFSMFYEEIAKTHPKLDTLLCVGRDIKQKTNELKNMYSQLLKHSVINFKTAQVYVQFQNFFLKQSNVNEQSIDRLKKIQKNKQADHIQEIFLPTLTSYTQNGLIENMNTECLSFFKLTRFQMKSKSFVSLLYPQMMSLGDIKEKLKQNKKQRFFTFFKRGDEYVYGSINIKEKYIQNKKFDVITIQKNPYSDFKNVILIRKDNHQVDLFQKNQTYIRPHGNFHNQLKINWSHIYQNYMKDKVDQLISQKIVKIRIEQYQNSLFVMSLQETMHSNYQIVNVKFIKDMEKRKNRVSSFMVNGQNKKQSKNISKQGKFHFFYDLQQKSDEIHLYGVDTDDMRFHSTLNKTKSLGKLQKDLNSMLIINTLLNQNRYSKGIKSYRLYDGELYNIDLQDKEQYVQQFQGQAFNNNNIEDQNKNQMDLYLITGIFLFIILFCGLMIFYNIESSSSHNQIMNLYSNTLRIEQLRLQMNRLVSITRDIQNGLYDKVNGSDWKGDILKTYTKLEAIRSQGLIFQSKQIIVNYRNITYSGTLNQIIDVFISHIYQLTVNGINLLQISQFHDAYIAKVSDTVIQFRDDLKFKLNLISNHFDSLKTVFLTLGLILIIAYYILLTFLMITLNELAKKKLNSLMLMSDTQARMNQTMADKLKYAVDMIKKNFDFDLKNILGPPQSHKQRKKPKQIIIGIQKKIFIVLVMALSLSLHITLFVNFTNNIPSVIKSITEFQKNGQYLFDTYSLFSELTNQVDHLNKYDMQEITMLRQNLNFLSLKRQMFQYDTHTNRLIDVIFYENSCQSLIKYRLFSNMAACKNMLPGYMVSNPFELGMISYFSRAHFNIVDNVTQTFGSTGIYSSIFVSIFSELVKGIKKYGQYYIENGFSNLTFYNILSSIFSIVYVIITIMVVYELKKVSNNISDLLKFLNYSSSARKNKKNSDKVVKSSSKMQGSSNSLQQNNSLNDKQKDDSKSELSNKQVQ